MKNAKRKKAKPRPSEEIERLRRRVAELEAAGVERRRAEERQRLVARILDVLNRSTEEVDAIREILLLIKEVSGIEAVGIRLRKGEDFPYYETNGFPGSFVEAERYLCAYDQAGEPIRDAQGNPVLECMCGNILCGRTDPLLPFFTEGGSFWSNNTTALLASTTEEERQARTRDRCNSEGYESVALVPLRSGSETIGLLQLNDSRKDMFTSDLIAFFEEVGASVGVSLARARAEEEVKQYAAQLNASNKELEAFAYSVSHDLRAPLRSIDGFSQVLLEDYAEKLGGEGRDYLERVRAGTQRMAALIDDLLNLSRISRKEMKRERVSLSALAREITDGLRRSQPGRDVEFVIARGLTVDGDAQLLRAALENLLGNAWKFTGKQDAARIEFGSTEKDGKTAYFVRDDGAGFEMAYAEKLFGAFQRLHSASEFEGTGIGLATVQRIVHRHGGRVWAEGEVGKGATFYFTLTA